MANSVFPTTVTGVTVVASATGAISGDGSSGNKLAVAVDGSTIDVNGSNELEVLGAVGGATAGPFTTITSIAVTDGIVTALTGS
jgi:hypothetical protein